MFHGTWTAHAKNSLTNTITHVPCDTLHKPTYMHTYVNNRLLMLFTSETVYYLFLVQVGTSFNRKFLAWNNADLFRRKQDSCQMKCLFCSSYKTENLIPYVLILTVYSQWIKHWYLTAIQHATQGVIYHPVFPMTNTTPLLMN